VNGNSVPKANRPRCAGQRPRALQSPPRRCYVRGKFMRRLPQHRSSSSAGSRYYDNLPHQQRANVAALSKSRATNDSSYLLKIPFHLVGGQQRRSAETFSRHGIDPGTPVGRCRDNAEPLCGAQPGEYTLPPLSQLSRSWYSKINGTKGELLWHGQTIWRRSDGSRLITTEAGATRRGEGCKKGRNTEAPSCGDSSHDYDQTSM
jgi:hypothetical protein